MTPPKGVTSLEAVRAGLERALLEAFTERVNRQPYDDETERADRLLSVRTRVVDLLDSWLAVVDSYRAVNADMQYQRHELSSLRPLLREMLEEEFESLHHRKFRANRSLRDVEPEVDLYIKPLSASRQGAQ